MPRTFETRVGCWFGFFFHLLGISEIQISQKHPCCDSALMNEPKPGEELISHLLSRLGDTRLFTEDSAHFLHMFSTVFDLTRHE